MLKAGFVFFFLVEKDERGNKGAALTTCLSLAGRYLVLMPNNPRGGGVSRRIEGEERQELKAAMAELEVPRGMSLIARTAGIGRSVEELQWDFNYLLQLWQAIEEAGNAHHEPYLLFMESSLLIRAVRDYFRPDIGEILVDNQEVYEQVSEFMSYVMPNNVGRLKLYEDHTPLFSRFQIEHQIESAFSRSVSLPSGGAIVIDHTEALVSVDVNSARATRGADIEDTAFKTNMEAAEEVARQMRLRDLGGLVVIDFIDMENPKHQRDVENTLRDALKKDRARVQMGKLSRFGLLELSRQRLKPALGESSHVACPRCAGTGVIRGIESTALHVLRIIQEEAMKDNTGEVHAQVPVDVATFLLNEKRAELFGLEERLDVSVFLIPNTHLENPHYEISRVRTDDVDEDAAPSYQRVIEPEKDDNVPFGSEKAKAARPEPAVKGVKHTQPAPIVAPEQPAGWWDGIKAWFGKLFAAESAPEAEPKKAERGGQQSQQTRRNTNRRQTPRRNSNSHNKRTDGEVEKAENKAPRAKEASAERNGEARNNDNRNNRNRRNQGDNANRERNNRANSQPAEQERRNQAPAEAAAAPRDSEPREPAQNRRRNNERNRNQNERRHEAEAVAQAEVVSLAAVAEEAVAVEAQAADSDTQQADNKRSRSNERNSQERNRNKRERRNNGKKRNIPSAAKIEQYLMIDEAGDKVRNAVAHVFGEAVEAPVAVSVPAAAVAQPEAVPEIAQIEAAVSPLLFAIEADEAPAHATPVAADEQVMVSDAAAQVKQAVAQLFEQAPVAAVDEEAVPVAPVAVAQPEAAVAVRADFAGFDLGGLVLVQTRVEALAAAAAAPQPEAEPALRRADLPKAAADDAPDMPLVQVETRR